MAIDGPTVIVVGAGTNAVANYANPDPMDQFMWYQTHGCGPAGGAELPRGQRQRASPGPETNSPSGAARPRCAG
jgi:hypothetical protein